MAEQLTVHLTGAQLLSVVLGIIVAATMLISWFGKQLRALFQAAKRIESALGVDAEGKTLRENVTELADDVTGLKGDVSGLHASLNNGIRTEVRAAAESSDQARQLAAAAATLAGRAATAAATAEQHSNDALRGVNAMRAGHDIVLRAVMRDLTGVWTALAKLGIDRRQYAIEDPADADDNDAGD